MGTMADDRNPIDLAADLLVYAPVGFAIAARELLPDLAERGRSYLDGQVALARAVGQVAVRQGQSEAGPAGLPRLAELAGAGVAEQAGDRGGAVWSAREARALPADESLAALLAREDCLVLAGCIDDAVIGYAVATVEQLRDGTVLGRIE